MAHDFKNFPELTNRQMQIYYFESPHKQILEDFKARVIKVIDGDTIRVQWDGRNFNFPIRFLNTAAPELDERGGLASQRFLENFLLNEEVDIVIDPNNRVEKWGRLLATIFIDGINVNQATIDAGYAVLWENRDKNQFVSIDKQLEGAEI
jgi:micrococcal nuclease